MIVLVMILKVSSYVNGGAAEINDSDCNVIIPR
jgi:hypothetical protein